MEVREATKLAWSVGGGGGDISVSETARTFPAGKAATLQDWGALSATRGSPGVLAAGVVIRVA